MKIAVIGGTGGQGLGIAIRFVQAKEDVIIGSRTIEKAQSAVNKIKGLLGKDNIPNLGAAENPDAAKQAEILILTVPLVAQKATLLSIKEGAAGKILMDATGPLETAIGGSPTRCLYLPEGAASERAQKILPETTVICAFNNISSGALMNFNEPIDCDCLISGDDLESKKTVAQLIEQIPGVNVVDCGPLERAQIIEKITPLLIGLNIKKTCKDAGIRITGIDPECKLY
ncbi:NADPH-dependent F420 reductase [Methanobacterium petrolearium]|uniref:NADPH-dependent F420 reductase n=1 Tax=Methanobacterium petrolearium TaxID=710190 RepID=UPI001AE31F41|nr:NADPH-dependent F420 reductase [Methanobacterium petrolearium]MBP1946456.1 NADPH-dependent F420 reductase [Methanobacterium petrolearium]BDZ70515.1 NADPH-dependent F420 reductase [Methanobacterium petrolearium]